MARSTRSNTLENRTSRLKLDVEKRHSVTIGKGLRLQYRRGGHSSSWYVKILTGDDKYLLHTLGQADDFQDANGVDVLDYFQAQDKARQFIEEAKRSAGTVQKPMTVGDAARTLSGVVQGSSQSLQGNRCHRSCSHSAGFRKYAYRRPDNTQHPQMARQTGDHATASTYGHGSEAEVWRHGRDG